MASLVDSNTDVRAMYSTLSLYVEYKLQLRTSEACMYTTLILVLLGKQKDNFLKNPVVQPSPSIWMMAFSKKMTKKILDRLYSYLNLMI
jgi:hypothetical protein